jgi:hypothetical protein
VSRQAEPRRSAAGCRSPAGQGRWSTGLCPRRPGRAGSRPGPVTSCSERAGWPRPAGPRAAALRAATPRAAWPPSAWPRAAAPH